MSITLDGQNLFDTHQLKFERASVKRDSIERTVAGLDGVLSVDLGERGRVIKQKGVLRMATREKMDERLNAIFSFLDGDTHTLITNRGEIIENLRMDIFNVGQMLTFGSGVECDYEIVYRQLVV